MTAEKRTLLQLNLQFFAKDGPGGEKTEQPTEKKLSDARKEGQVAKSQELGNAVSLISIFLILKFTASFLGENFVANFAWIYSKIPSMIKLINGSISSKSFTNLITQAILRMIIMLLPFFLIGAVVSFIVNLIQVRWKPTAKPLQPKFSKINPIKGVKRIFSKEKILELVKSIIKIAIIGGVAYNMLKDQVGLLLLLYDIPLTQAVLTIGSIVIDVGLRISIIYLVLGFVDFGYQKWKFHDDMKMTKQEVKDEWKNSEGDPQIKSRIRQRMREASQRRMMQNVPEADVVITNPTHFAVALKYDNQVADAPIVTAKGQDFVAQKIKEIARKNHVEIVENKPLARMLYHNVELNGMVPPELYQAVAEVLAFVYNLKKKTG